MKIHQLLLDKYDDQQTNLINSKTKQTNLIENLKKIHNKHSPSSRLALKDKNCIKDETNMN